MWLFTKYGFYSIVQKRYKEQVKPFQIRSRKKKDLENLKKLISIEEDVMETLTADYQYRLIVDENELSECLALLVRNLDYDNFKSEVGKTSDQTDKLNAYHDIWNVMYSYQNKG